MEKNTGRIELIIGCMYSGKTTEIIRRIQMYLTLNKPVAIFTHSSDTRYCEEGNIVTHNQNVVKGIPLNILHGMFDMDIYKNSEIIFIEEGQFFPDLFETVIQCANTDGKHVIVSGLDGDFLLNPFEQIVRLIPHAEYVKKYNALCKKCGDGTPASFSKRIVDSNVRELIGSDGIYEAVCRKHYYHSNISNEK